MDEEYSRGPSSKWSIGSSVKNFDTQESVTDALGDDTNNAGNNIADNFGDRGDSQDELLLAARSREIKWSSDDPVI